MVIRWLNFITSIGSHHCCLCLPSAMAPSSPSNLPFHLTFAASAFSACTAEVVSLPLDTAKVKLQLQQSTAAPKYR